MMKSGMKIRSATIAECVGPLWNSVPKSMSMSGIIDSTRIVGMFGLTLKVFAEALAMR